MSETSGPHAPVAARTAVSVGGDTAGDPWERATTILAGLCVVVVGFNRVVTPNVSLGLLLAAALAPMWIRELAQFRYARAITLLTAAALVWGDILARSTVDRRVSEGYAFVTWTLVASGLAALILVLWARTRLPLNRIVLLYGSGALAGALATGGRTWKFDLAVPVILIFLGLVDTPRRRLPTALGLLAFGVFSAVSDGRSLFAFCAVAAALTIWQIRPTGADQRLRPWRTGLLLATGAVVFYLVMSGLLTSGALGPELQERSVNQVESTGNLLLGGRPEWSANLELMRQRPHGYGLGVTSDWRDLTAAREGFASIRFDPGGYATYYMFGGAFALHAIAADLWVMAGWVGLTLAALLLWTLASALVVRLERRSAPGFASFAATLGCWYVLFGPIYSNWLDVCVAVGIVAVARWSGDIDQPPAGEEPTQPDRPRNEPAATTDG